MEYDASIMLIALSFLLMLFLVVSVAASNARKRKVKCRELAEHATIVDKIVRHADVPEALITAMAEMKGVVGALKEALEEALELVGSCRKGWRRFRLCRAADVDRFDDVGRKLDHRLQSLLLLLQIESMAKFSMVKTAKGASSKNTSQMQSYQPSAAMGKNQSAATTDACVVNVNPTLQMVATTSTVGCSDYGN